MATLNQKKDPTLPVFSLLDSCVLDFFWLYIYAKTHALYSKRTPSRIFWVFKKLIYSFLNSFKIEVMLIIEK